MHFSCKPGMQKSEQTRAFPAHISAETPDLYLALSTSKGAGPAPSNPHSPPTSCPHCVDGQPGTGVE